MCAIRECWEETGIDVSNKINFYDKIEVESKNATFFIVYNMNESIKVLN
jgi:8-oxo-dGTP pyrophosphatase MutT (NUDIX family)